MISPVLKWPGGKRQILNQLLAMIPTKYGTYCEPFVGGGALLFALQPKKAIINDINAELINLYSVIKDSHNALISELKTLKYDKNTFYKIRSLDRDKERFALLSPVKKAARFVYLNKCCFNGLYRVNKRGEFNAPFGRYTRPDIVNAQGIKRVNEFFNKANVSFSRVDFYDVVNDLKDGDFVYFDPPYDPASKTANFTSYSQHGFNVEDQKRLKECCDDLTRRNVKFMLSNTATPCILKLYDGYDVTMVKERRAINSDVNKRGAVDVVIIRNYQ